MTQSVTSDPKLGLCRSGEHTKISSAERDLVSELLDMAPGDFKGGGGWSMKGFRETGRGGGSSKGDAGEAGEAALLRKGLLEERLILRLADACESVAS